MGASVFCLCVPLSRASNHGDHPHPPGEGQSALPKRLRGSLRKLGGFENLGRSLAFGWGRANRSE